MHAASHAYLIIYTMNCSFKIMTLNSEFNFKKTQIILLLKVWLCVKKYAGQFKSVKILRKLICHELFQLFGILIYQLNSDSPKKGRNHLKKSLKKHSLLVETSKKRGETCRSMKKASKRLNSGLFMMEIWNRYTVVHTISCITKFDFDQLHNNSYANYGSSLVELF